MQSCLLITPRISFAGSKQYLIKEQLVQSVCFQKILFPKFNLMQKFTFGYYDPLFKWLR